LRGSLRCASRIGCKAIVEYAFEVFAGVCWEWS